jgi:hypothetical protein
MITGNSLSEAWRSSLRLFLQPRDLTRLDTARGPCFELRDVAIRIEEPGLPTSVPGFPDVNLPLIQSFAARFLDSADGRNSTLAARLYRWPTAGSQAHVTFDQIAHARDLIATHPEARFNIVSVWDPTLDPLSPHPVSPLLASFHVRAGATATRPRLHATLVVRALDAWLGAVPMFGGFAALQEDLARTSTYDVGTLTLFILSYHVYELDMPTVLDIASDGL